MTTGWIRLHRSILDDKIYSLGEFSYGHAWIDLLLLAEYKPREKHVNKVSVELDRGQLVVSIRYLASRWKWGEKKVRCFIDKLERYEMITVKKSAAASVVTIVNYEKYQAETFFEQENRGTLKGTPQGTNIKNIRNKEYINPAFFSDEKGGSSENDEVIKALKEEVEALKAQLVELQTPDKPKRKKAVNPSFAPCKKAFEDYYNEMFQAAYYWQAKDSVAMNSLIKKITNSRKTKGFPVDGNGIKEGWVAMLKSIRDEWLLNNFSVTIIDSKYNEIVAQANQNKNQNGNRNLTPAQQQRQSTIEAIRIVSTREKDDLNNVVW